MKKPIAVMLAAAAAAFALAAPLAQAHHSAIQFDFTKNVPVKGTVKKFELINPHMRLILQVSDAKGTRDVEFEGHSRNNMFRLGWRPDMVKEGDAITVNIAPLKSGVDGGFVMSVVNKEGRFFGMQASGQRRP